MKKILFISCFFILSLFITTDSIAQDNGAAAERLKAHVSFLAADTLEGRGLGTEGKIFAKKYIAEQFRLSGLHPYDPEGSYFQHLNLRIGLARVPAANVIGYIEGNDPVLKDEYIVVGAHYDHLGYEFTSESGRMRNLLLGSGEADTTEKKNEKIIYRGADDNASGVAAMMEIARAMSLNKEKIKRSIIFIAFDAEESGLFGAYRFIEENSRFDIKKVKLMFSLDMVGMYNKNGGLILKGIGALEGGAKLAEEIAAVKGITLKDVSAEIELQTDTAPFGDKGIPAAHAFTGIESPYHKTEDTYDKLEYDGMAKVSGYLTGLITEVSGMPALKSSAEFLGKKESFAIQTEYGVLAGLGTAHNEYPDEFFIAKSVFAVNLGFFIQLSIGKKFTFQPELLVSADGSKSPQGTFRRYSAFVPVHIKYNLINIFGGMVKAFPFAGGYYKFSFAGNNGGVKLDFENQYNRSEAGISLGIGVEVMRVIVAGNVQMALTKLPKAGGEKIYSSGSYLTLGYRL
ncbi:MAG: M20/M25/M40 family metallo-hydrolase [Ignavibacteriaceae bacterium]|nr:M20/M25/M40 family metallo-hydrolase [Ignavibacteriaceae bacterium]